MWIVRVFVVVVCAVMTCANDGIHSMLNQLVHNSGSDAQSLSACVISTRDVITTAESTATRVLQGVCNPREMNNRFLSLERQIVDQFNVLKTMVLNIEDQMRNQDQEMKRSHGRLRKQLRSMGSGFVSRRQGAAAAAAAAAVEDTSNTRTQYHQGSDYEDSYDTAHEEQHEQSPREPEIYRFNSTMHQEDGEIVFTYYWRIRDVPYKMDHWGQRRSLRSNSFYISQGGYKMYLRIFPNHEGENFYVHVGLTRGEYDDSIAWPFRLKHQVRIIDHTIPPEDLVSRLWDPSQLCSEWHWRRPASGDNYECVGLGFTKETLRSRKYIMNNSVVIKLTVILNF